MLDNSDDVTSYLASGAISGDQRPKNLIKMQQEEIKRALEDSDTDYEAYFTSLPKDSKFVRFAKLPKDIVFRFN